jgi:hypothetical protein
MLKKKIFISALGCTMMLHTALSSAVETCPLPAKPVSSEEEAIDLAERAVQAYKLTEKSKLSLECITFSYNKKNDKQYVDVREKHSQKCGGNPQTAPRVLTITIDTDGRMSTDVYDHESDQPLFCASKLQSIVGRDKLPPDVIASEFYEWYLHMLDVGHEPLFDDKAVLSSYVSKELIRDLQRKMKHSKDSDIDYFTQTVDFDTAWAMHMSASKPEINGNTATVVIFMTGESNTTSQNLTLTLTQEGNIWKIREIRILPVKTASQAG